MTALARSDGFKLEVACRDAVLQEARKTVRSNVADMYCKRVTEEGSMVMVGLLEVGGINIKWGQVFQIAEL